MNTIIELLSEKNEILMRFHKLNEEELLNFVDGNFDRFEEFYSQREDLLNLVKDIDAEVGDLNEEEINGPALSDIQKAQVLKLIELKNEIVQNILAQDLQILSMIESAKTEIIKELRQTQTVRKGLAGYKQSVNDKKLSEEA